MSVINNNLLLTAPAAASTTGVSRSLRFNSADSAYLSRTPASDGNRRTWTWVGWVKRSVLGSTQALMSVQGTSDSTTAQFWFSADDKFRFGIETADIFVTDAVFRDCSAWYHIVFAFDATNATSADKMILYVNGVRQTTSTYTAPSNTDYGFNRASAVHSIGRRQNNSDWYFNGYLADCYLVDGQQLTPSSFTETDATTGQLIPKAFSGTYGTNGFHLDFADNSAATATTLGKDTSGNGNNWTPNNLSVTAGAGNDSLVDVPTNGVQTDTGVGGQVRGNYCTWNPLDAVSGISLANGNLDSTISSSGVRRGTIAVSSGKWYWEISITSAADRNVGIAKVDPFVSSASYLGSVSGQIGYYDSQSFPSGAGVLINNGAAGVNYGAYYVNGDVIGVALNLDAGQITFYVNGVSQGVAVTGITGTWSPAISGGSSAGASMSANFGQRAFAYTAPSGFKALCTANLPAPLVTKPNTVMDVKLYTGNSGNQSITLPGGFNPDLVWIKSRSNSQGNYLFDAIRGGAGILRSNTTIAETTGTTYLSFDTSGFSSLNGLSSNGYTYAAWCWDAGSSTVTNTAGSITSSVRANPTAGFSVVTYTATSGTNTIGHGLGVAPALIINKRRDSAENWYAYHTSLGSGNYLVLNATNASAALSWGGAPTSTVFYNSTSSFMTNGGTYVAYCFSPVVGYSSFGNYIGNGSADGPFVYTGFRPRWIMIKPLYQYDGGGSTVNSTAWYIYDSARGTYNGNGAILGANNSYAEENNATDIDFLSNGFKLRNTRAVNTSSGAIYAAFAESPFNYARAR